MIPDARPLLPKIDALLMQLLRSLTPADWQRQTVAKQWVVKDVVAHLLDGNIRILSMIRDGYQGKRAEIHSYQDLLDYLNKLNADWVKAMDRVSPEMLIVLHELTGPMYCDFYAQQDLNEKAAFAVNWAGEDESLNWMHIAREYTEKFIHQQQIRDTLGDHTLMSREYFFPYINISMLALPYTFRNVEATEGTAVKVIVESEAGGSWNLIRQAGHWELTQTAVDPNATITIAAPDAWKLFSKSWRAEDVKDRVLITGDQSLAHRVLDMVAVMA